PDVSHQQQASALHGILLRKFAGGHASRKQLLTGAVKLEIRELAVLVAFGNARGREQSLGTRLPAAVTAGYTTLGADRDWFPASTFTQRTNVHGDFHDLGSFSLSNFALLDAFCASAK